MIGFGRAVSTIFLSAGIVLASGLKYLLVNGQSLSDRASPATSSPSDKEQQPSQSVCLSFGLEPHPEASAICNEFTQAATTGQWEAATQSSQKLKTLYPQSGIGEFCRGYAELKQGKHVAAVRHLQAALNRAPGVVVVHLNLGAAFLALRQYRLFEEEMLWVIANSPKEALPHYYLGLHFSGNPSQLDQAAEHFQRAVDRDPNDFKSHYELGRLLQAKGDLQRAKARFETAETKASSQGVPYSQPLERLAEISLRLGDFAAAFRQAQMAVTRDPKSASARLLLGKLLVQRSETKGAIQELKVSALLDPTSATPHYWLSRAYQQMKMTDAAKQELDLFTRIKATYGADE